MYTLLPFFCTCPFSFNFKFFWSEPNSLLILNALLWRAYKTKTAPSRIDFHPREFIRNLQTPSCGVPSFWVQRDSLGGVGGGGKYGVLLSIEGSPTTCLSGRWSGRELAFYVTPACGKYTAICITWSTGNCPTEWGGLAPGVPCMTQESLQILLFLQPSLQGPFPEQLHTGHLPPF